MEELVKALFSLLGQLDSHLGDRNKIALSQPLQKSTGYTILDLEGMSQGSPSHWPLAFYENECVEKLERSHLWERSAGAASPAIKDGFDNIFGPCPSQV